MSKLTREEKKLAKQKLKEEKRKNSYKNIKFNTFTKFFVAIIIVTCLIDLQLSYVLAFMDKIQIAEALSQQICTTILGTAFVYMVRAYFDSKAEYGSKVQDNKILKDVTADLKNKMQNILNNSGSDSISNTELEELVNELDENVNNQEPIEYNEG